MHSPPRPTLVPLTIRTPAVRRWLEEYRAGLSHADRGQHASFQAACEARLNRERPFRVANQRQRLHACYWAAPCPGGFSTRGLLRTPLIARHGAQRPAWLVRGVAP